MTIYVDDIGTEIVLDTKISLVDATTVAIKVKLPNGNTTQWAGTVVEGTKIKHVLLAADLVVPGTYLLQAYVVTPSWTAHGKTVKMEALPQFGGAN